MSNDKHIEESQINQAKSDDACAWKPGQQSECGDTLWQPPRLDVKFFGYVTLLLCILIGLTFIQNLAAIVVWVVICLTWLFGCPRTKRATISVTTILYLPYLWFVFYHDRGDSNLSPLLPMLGHAWGVLPAKWLMSLVDVNVKSLNWIAAVTTICFFLVAVTIVRFWPQWRWVVFSLVLVTAAIFSGLIYRGQ